MTETKVCTKCGLTKLKSEFNKQKSSKDGLAYYCKECRKKEKSDYYKTIDGLITRIYGSQKYSSKDRGHVPPNYSKEKLKDWILAQTNFESLFNNWVSSGYLKDLVPSCDRKDDYQGYSLDRLTLTSWGEHNKKSWSDRKNGANNKDSKAVFQYTKEGSFIKEHHSIQHADRETGINASNISQCCLGRKYKSAGGYVWRYKD